MNTWYGRRIKSPNLKETVGFNNKKGMAICKYDYQKYRVLILLAITIQSRKYNMFVMFLYN